MSDCGKIAMIESQQEIIVFLTRMIIVKKELEKFPRCNENHKNRLGIKVRMSAH